MTLSNNISYIPQTQRGINTGINPLLDSGITELAKAVNFIPDCLYPVISNHSETENQYKMAGKQLEFALELLNAKIRIVDLVANLRNLTTSDNSLSVGNNVCYIPPARDCIQPNWTNVMIK